MLNRLIVKLQKLFFQDKSEWIGPKVMQFLLDHPTFLLTLLYTLISGLGLLYDIVLFSEFGVNVLNYSDVADFFLAPFKRPEAFFISLSIVGIFFGYRLLANYARECKNLALKIFLLSFSWVGLFRREILIPLSAFYFIFFYAETAQFEARKILLQSNALVKLTTRFDEKKDLLIIPLGATENFFFGIEPSENLKDVRVLFERLKKVEIKPVVRAIPFSNITRIEYSYTTLKAKKGHLLFWRFFD